jgi:GNAT superfamily N-acetyltransferase
MDIAALARLEHENMIESIAAAGGLAPGAVVSREGGVALVATGMPLRLFNQVVIERDDASPEAVAAAVAMTSARGDRFVVNLRRGTDDPYLPLMDELGLVPLSEEPWIPGMALHPVPATGSVPPGAGHEIRRVGDSRGIRDHVETAAAGFEMPVSWLEAIMTDEMLDRDDIAVYVGYTDGVPVTTGMGLRTGGTIGIYNIATVEAARRRGYGAAMTMRIVDDGAAAGCDVAILQASDMGYPIYERLGFRTVVEYVGYVDPASLEPQADQEPDDEAEPDEPAPAG